ncbi:MAG: methylaspartate ammonia-lyase, partial [Erysipelotrichaceae bacterium]|nr:methylaspartate ammonia-lyase [Erysipelotrichaceae bacterium]
MKIVEVVSSCGRTGFFFDDQKAIKKGAVADGNFYIGDPVTEGFTRVRQAGESLTILLVLEDGQVAMGDCCAVQYSGCGGRDPLFIASDFQKIVQERIRPLLLNRELTSFKSLAYEFDHLELDGKRIHTALRYGITQAILDAVAKANHTQMANIIANEYHTYVSDQLIPIFSQSGDNRYDNVDKMIIKESAVLPHGLINNVETKLGYQGEKLLDYVKWLRKRIDEHRNHENYYPVLHIDVYGTLGIIFKEDYDTMVEYLRTLREASGPYHLRIEGPVDFDDREKTMIGLQIITRKLDELGIDCEIVADEWCNTLEDIKEFADKKAGHMVQIKTPDLGGIQNIVEAVLYCKEKGIGAYQGGTCNETDISAKACVHCAMATQPVQILAK